jgi:CheY-like chemotaxis protein
MQKILMVDDDPAMRGLIKKRLSDTYEVIDTGDPEQALGLALEHKPDAILLDLMMPKFSGFELCQSFHSLSYSSRIPIIVISRRVCGKVQGTLREPGSNRLFRESRQFSGTQAQARGRTASGSAGTAQQCSRSHAHRTEAAGYRCEWKEL